MANAFRLEPLGWQPATRRRLESLIRAGAGRHWPAAFDFDHTLVCGDIGEATLASLARDGLIRPEHVPPHVAPEFRARTGKRISPRTLGDLTDYYEAFLDPTAHGELDPTPLSNGYVWAATVMQGCSVQQVVRATEKVYDLSRPGHHALITTAPGRTGYPVPFFYPEMIDLLALLLRSDFDVWIVSASNVWSLRWMVLKALNPLLRSRGVRKPLRADHVIGVSTLLLDRQQRFYKDPVLVRADPAYARMDGPTLARFRLTTQIHFPAPVYSGKVAALWDAIRRPPFLAAGDSPGDLPMLTFAENRLWIARSNKPRYQTAVAAARQATDTRTWLVQPTQTAEQPGFKPRPD